jgi:hypothetical protein
MFVHCVYFWLKPDLSEADLKSFHGGIESLGEIETVAHLWTGTPADTDRPIIDKTYSFGLIVVFENLADHDVYQDHEIHLAFVKKFETFWERVHIYDLD